MGCVFFTDLPLAEGSTLLDFRGVFFWGTAPRAIFLEATVFLAALAGFAEAVARRRSNSLGIELNPKDLRRGLRPPDAWPCHGK